LWFTPIDPTTQKDMGCSAVLNDVASAAMKTKS
jgi:hypothetical protein